MVVLAFFVFFCENFYRILTDFLFIFYEIIPFNELYRISVMSKKEARDYL